MSRGKRYDTEPKLNMKKVFAVIIAIVVIIMFVFMIKRLFTKENKTGKIVSKSFKAINITICDRCLARLKKSASCHKCGNSPL